MIRILILAIFGLFLTTTLPVAQAAQSEEQLPFIPQIAIEAVSTGGFEHPRNHFQFDGIEPGQTLQGQAILRNVGDAPGNAYLYPVDMSTNNQGDLAHAGREDVRDRAGAWVDMSLDEISLEPGEATTVDFTVTVPQDARPGDHVAGVVIELMDGQMSGAAQAEEGEESVGVQLTIRSRIATGILMKIAGESVESMTATTAHMGGSNGYQHVFVGLRNEGNVDLKAQGTVEVLDGDGNLLQQGNITLDHLLPGDEITPSILVDGEALGLGDYQAVVDISYGRDKQINTTLPFSIEPEALNSVFYGSTETTLVSDSLLATMPDDTLSLIMAVSFAILLLLILVIVLLMRQQKQQRLLQEQLLKMQQRSAT